MRVAARRGMWGFGVLLLIGPVGQVGFVAGCGEAGVGVTGSPVDPAAGVALLAVVEGQVKVRHGDGVEVAAAAEMALLRTDTVITTPGALVVVVLANGYVIKLEEDQSTPVRALAHLDDPPASESMAELFEKALGAEEFARVGGADRLERIAGWNARRASGETPAPVVRSAPEPSSAAPAAAPAPVEAEEAAGGAKADAKMEAPGRRGDIETSTSRPRDDPAPSQQAPLPKTPEKNSKGKRPADDGGDPEPDTAPKTESKKSSGDSGAPISEPEAPSNGPSPQPAPPPPPPSGPDLSDSWTLETGDKGHVLKFTLPALLAGQRRSLGECVAGALPKVAAPELRLRVVGGVIKEVALGGGKAAPACAKGLIGKSLPEAGSDGWVVVRARR